MPQTYQPEKKKQGDEKISVRKIFNLISFRMFSILFNPQMSKEMFSMKQLEISMKKLLRNRSKSIH